jgi:hypothetical protein
MMGPNKNGKSINFKGKEVLHLECIIAMIALKYLHMHALNMHYLGNCLYISQQRIQFLKNMMEDSKIYLNRSMKSIINSNLHKKSYGISID